MRSSKAAAVRVAESAAEAARRGWRAVKERLAGRGSAALDHARGHDGSEIRAGMRVDSAYGEFSGEVTVTKVLGPGRVELEYEDGVKDEGSSAHLVPWRGGPRARDAASAARRRKQRAGPARRGAGRRARGGADPS